MYSMSSRWDALDVLEVLFAVLMVCHRRRWILKL